MADEAAPRLSAATMNAIVSAITGDPSREGHKPLGTYRKMSLITEFLRSAGAELNDPRPPGSRGPLVREVLTRSQGTQLLRSILEAAVNPAEFVGTEIVVEDVANHLNVLLRSDGYELRRAGHRFRLVSLTAPDIDPSAVEAVTLLNDAYVQEQIEKCETKFAVRDYDGAVTNARTLLESTLVALERELTGERSDFKGDLALQFKNVAKLLRMDDKRPELDEHFKKVVRGLVQIVDGLAPLRNKLSDAHARVARPAPHHVRLIINAVKSVVLFLVESYDYQAKRAAACARRV